MTQLFTKNKKIMASNDKKHVVYNFGIPANSKNCSKCKLGKACYARNGAYNWPQVKNAYDFRYKATLKKDFSEVVVNTLHPIMLRAEKQQKQLVIRIHDSGDFYSKEYAMSWISAANSLKSVQFYAYTKEVALFKELQQLQLMPDNLTIIFSYGGTEDHLINPNVDRHARIFSSLTELLDNGYRNAMLNDLNAIGPNPKVGLIYHGPKKYSKSISI